MLKRPIPHALKETGQSRVAIAQALYIRPNGELSLSQPAGVNNSFDEYMSDPAKPVPFINNINIGMTREYMVDDQRFASRRQDVPTYALCRTRSGGGRSSEPTAASPPSSSVNPRT